jgi:hypothetical protein
MVEPHPANEMHHRKDSSNFQYAGMYLTFVATMLYLIVFLIKLAFAMDVLELAGEWIWDVVWEAVLNFLILLGGFIAVYLTYKRRGYPAVITIMTLMLAVSLLNILYLNIWPDLYRFWITLTLITFIVTLVAFIKLSIGHKEFISPRLKREMKAKDKRDVREQWDDKPIYHDERRKKAPRKEEKKVKKAPARAAPKPPPKKQKRAQPPPKPAPKPRARKPARPRREGTSMKIINCIKCAEMYPNDEPYCPLCGDDSNKKKLLEKIQIAYESGVISEEQYRSNLQRFGD